jgi:hypothetical protein
MSPVPRLLRAVALLIAGAAVLDPGVTMARPSETVVAVVPGGDGAPEGMEDAVAAALADAFTVVRGPWPTAAATVVAGAALPRMEALPATGPVFAVLPEAPPVRLLAVRRPASAPLHGTVPVGAVVELREAGPVELRLLREGVLVDQVDTVATAAGRMELALWFVPAAAGPVALRVEARSGGGAAAEDLVVDVVSRRWRVLFLDGRPNWMSTFVRRTLEQDPRFIASARVNVSTGIATAFGAAPAGAADAGGLLPFDVVVVGAPETLAPGAVAALEAFLRRRGGAVLLVPDRLETGPWMRLAGGGPWRQAEGAVLAPREGSGDTVLRAGARAWPATLPPGARPLVTDVAGNAVLWQGAVGGGRVVVSGALDSWRHRDPESSGFGAFWPDLIARLAVDAAPVLEGRVTELLAPGEWGALEVVVREPALQGQGSVSLAARLDDGGPVHLAPAAEPGVLLGEFRAPQEPGMHWITVASGAEELRLPLVVAAASAPAPRGGGEALLGALVAARGGAMLPAAEAAALPALLQQQLGAARGTGRVHPMRSAWWLLPFVAALGGEWWWRRRRGLA